MDDLLSDFLSETSDHIDGIASYLVTFEQNPSDSDAVTQIFRLVHTLKGTSGFLGLNRLQAIAHAAETLIDTLRDGAPPTQLAVSLLFKAFDQIKDLLANIAELGEEPEGDDSEIIQEIEAYLQGDLQDESQTDREPEAEPEPAQNTELASEPEPEPEPELAPESEPALESEPAPALTLAPETDLAPEPNLAPEPELALEPDLALEPELISEPDLVSEPDLASELDLASEPELAPELEPAPEPEPEPEPEAPSKQAPAPQPEAASAPQPTVAAVAPVKPASSPQKPAKAAEAAPPAAKPAAAKKAVSPKPVAKAPSSKEAEPAQSKQDKAPDSIRLAVATIQRIMDLVSELVLTRNQIMDLSRQHNLSQIKSPLERLSTVTSDLQDAVMRARMQPMTRLFASVPRLVRELSVELKKKYNLIIEGAETELDRQLIETIKDPLTHLIRNCADHGIERPEDRIAAGKSEAGEIKISAYYESGQVNIEISDDGRGLDAERIRAKAVERGLGSAEAIAAMSDEEAYRFILEPGFSTAAAITTVSGRGVGMDVVRANIESIGGTISLHSVQGRGSKFVLKIPLTLAIAPALIVRVGEQRFAVPQQYVVEAVSLDEEISNLKTMEDVLLLELRDELIPVVALCSVLELPLAGRLENKLVVVLGLRGQKLGIIVDEIDDIQEIVVKPLGSLFSRLKLFSGNTILGDGSVILIVDPAGVASVMNLEKAASVLPPQDGLADNASISSLILFKAGDGAPKVLPRSAVSRILRVPLQDIYHADGRHLYRYRDKFIPILPVAGAGVTAGKCLILVLSVYGKTFGLWVDSVLDIVESAAEIQLSSGTPSVLGAADIQGTAVEFIDAGYYFRKAFEENLRSSDKGKANLLIVDSEPGAHDMLRPILTAAGHKVTAAETAEQANKLLHQISYKVILLDAKMTGQIDDTALARQTEALCLIFDEDRYQDGQGGDNVLSKFDRTQLIKTIARHLDKRDGAKAALSVSEYNASFG